MASDFCYHQPYPVFQFHAKAHFHPGATIPALRVLPAVPVTTSHYHQAAPLGRAFPLANLDPSSTSPLKTTVTFRHRAGPHELRAAGGTLILPAASWTINSYPTCHMLVFYMR